MLDGDPALPASKMGAEPPSPIFGPFLLWPNGCMHQDATWYGGRPRPRRLCVRWGPSYPRKKGTPTPTQFLAHVYCDQMAGWMKTPLGTEVDLGPGHFVLDWVPNLRERDTTAPFFSAHVYCGRKEGGCCVPFAEIWDPFRLMSIVAGWRGGVTVRHLGLRSVGRRNK